MAHHEPQGAWVWILDDDDECIHDGLVADVRHIADTQPDAQVWGQAPVLGHIGCSAFIVRADIWQRHRHAFGGGEYASDFAFIAAAWAEEPEVYWHDVIASRCQNGRNMGATEQEISERAA